MSNLGGHDLETVLEAFGSIGHDRPVCFLAYTIKGIGLPFQGHKDNHAGLMSVKQMDTWRLALGVREGHEWDKFEGLDIAPQELEAFFARVPFAAKGRRRLSAPSIAVPDTLPYPRMREASTQQGFGLILNDLARSEHADRKARRHDLARRHGLDQPRILGEPARIVRARTNGPTSSATKKFRRAMPGSIPRAASTSNSASRR